MEPTIREASTEDAALIADLSRHTFIETFASQNTVEDMEKFMAETFTTNALMEEVGAMNNLFFLCYKGIEPIGYAKLREGEIIENLATINAIEVARIYVLQNVIGKGAGKLLMQQCIATAKKRKKEIIWLGVWEKNQRAIEFYRKFGFEKFGEHAFVLGNDVQTDWLMKKEL